MATVIIQKRKRECGQISYAVRYKDPLTRKSKHHKTYPRLKDAQAAANELRAILDLGKLAQKPNKKTALKFSEVAEKLKADWQEKLDSNDIAEKTFYDYCIWLDAMAEIFGKKLLRAINTADVKQVIAGIAKSSSKVNANRHLAAIKKVFKLGLQLNAISEDVTADIKAYSEKAHQRNSFLYPRELNRLVKKARLTRAKFYLPAIIYLGAEHGASKQEILSLCWKDIQFDFGKSGLIRFYRTKNKRQRTEYLMPRTRQALLDWKTHLKYRRNSAGVKDLKSDCVFCRIDGTPIKNFNNAWWAARRLAGIYDFHFHDLRHTFCSNLIMSGADLKDAKEMIGHADIAMTDRYAHLSGIYKQHLQLKLAEHYGSLPAD